MGYNGSCVSADYSYSPSMSPELEVKSMVKASTDFVIFGRLFFVYVLIGNTDQSGFIKTNCPGVHNFFCLYNDDLDSLTKTTHNLTANQFY